MLLTVKKYLFLTVIYFFTYYFKPDSIQLYNGNMNYLYSLYIHEIDVPIQIKLSNKRENNALLTTYVMFGYHFRTLLFGNLRVSQYGREFVSKREDITFKN